ncbi:MAG: hypothetical protein AB1725_12510, partial [Armatimonadota bacterium]
RLWDASSGDASLVLGRADSPMKAVAFSPSGNRLFAGGLDRKLHAWRASPQRASTSNQRRHNR